jgi:hypothetical protein
MSASWRCLRCDKIISSMMPAALVVRGHFRVDKDNRLFEPNDSTQEALCADCLEVVENELTEDPEDPLEPPSECAECGIELDAGSVCKGCHEAKHPVLEPGVALVV